MHFGIFIFYDEEKVFGKVYYILSATELKLSLLLVLSLKLKWFTAAVTYECSQFLGSFLLQGGCWCSKYAVSKYIMNVLSSMLWSRWYSGMLEYNSSAMEGQVETRQLISPIPNFYPLAVLFFPAYICSSVVDL